MSTTFFILENNELGTRWVSQTKMKLKDNGFPMCRSLTHDELNIKLKRMYPEYSYPYLYLHNMSQTDISTYGVERWLSKFQYKIKHDPIKYSKLDQLLRAGWSHDDFTINSTLSVINVWDETTSVGMYSTLKKHHGCLNCIKETRKERYERCKKYSLKNTYTM